MNRIEIFTRTFWKDLACVENYYSAPTCNKLEQNFKMLFEECFYFPEDGSFRSENDQVLARLEEKNVQYLDSWIPETPRYIKLPGLVKNPNDVTFISQDVKVGAKNSILLYKNYFFAAVSDDAIFSVNRPVREPYQTNFRTLYLPVFENLGRELILTR